MAEASEQLPAYPLSYDEKAFSNDIKPTSNEIESTSSQQSGPTFKNGVVKFSGLFASKGEVTNADTGAVLYTIKANKAFKTTLEWKVPGEDSPIGHAKFHLTHCDFDFRGQTFSVKVANKLMTKSTYESPALQGQNLTWKCKCHMKNIEYTLVDEKDIPIAKLEVNGIWWTSRGCNLQITEPYSNNPVVVEEVMATSSALAWYTLVCLWSSIV